MFIYNADGGERGSVRVRERRGGIDAFADGNGAAARLPGHEKLHRCKARHGGRK